MSRRKNDRVILDDDYYIGLKNDNVRRKRKLSKRTSNRIKIVTGLVVFALVIILCIVGIVWLIANGVSGGKSNVDTKPTVAVSDGDTKANTQDTTKPANTEPEYLSFTSPKIKSGDLGVNAGSLYLYNKEAYEKFSGNDSMINTYVNTIEDLVATLPKGVKAYDMIIPTHCEMSLPDNCKEDAGVSSQLDYIKTAYTKFHDNGKLTPINIYNVLADHNDEYIYFAVDHHWTGLGAYYAYTAFAQQTKQEVMTISEEKSHSITGFRGSFAGLLSSNWNSVSDTVTYYDLPYTTSMKIYGGDYDGETSVYYPYAAAGANTYGVFIWGDQPREVIKSECGTDKKIAVVKESFGNAFVPYLTNNYSEVHVLDLRDCGVKLSKYVQENDIDEVIFINNVMSTASSDRIINMEALK